jgi:hypothetical protein
MLTVEIDRGGARQRGKEVLGVPVRAVLEEIAADGEGAAVGAEWIGIEL